MSFPDPATFFKAVGFMIFIILIFGGFCFWIGFVLKKVAPNLKNWFKYNLLKKPYNEDVVALLMEYDQADYSVDEVSKIFLLNGHSMAKTKEFLFIYDQIRKKGGKK